MLFPHAPLVRVLKRRFGKKLNRLIRVRVAKAEMGGMEEHPITVPASAIKAVADNRCGKPQRVGGVHPELMGATGEGCQGDTGVCPLHGDFFPDGASHLASFRIINL